VFSSKNQTALITGASFGIGLELARLFARDGFNLILVARSLDRLNQFAESFGKDFGVFVKVLAKDLSLPSAPDEIFEELKRESIHVDVLVNNAGFGIHGRFAKSDLKTQLNLIQVNIVSLTHLTRLLLPGMLERKQGGVLNIASTAAFQAGPLMAAYFASKAYVLSLTEALANETRGTGVRVTALCPGPTATEFQKRSNTEDVFENFLGLMKASRVAEAGFSGFKKGKSLVIPGFMNKLQVFIVRLFPRKWVTAAARFVEEKQPSKASK